MEYITFNGILIFEPAVYSCAPVKLVFHTIPLAYQVYFVVCTVFKRLTETVKLGGDLVDKM
jgi:hypothetical protein